MSLLQSPRRPSSDTLEPDSDLHVGLDRELDLSAERPSLSVVEPTRGPGAMVAMIVASSLALAGIIMLARGEPSEVSAKPAPTAPVPEVLASPAEPEPADPGVVVEPAGGEDVRVAAAREVAPPSALEAGSPPPSASPASSEITPASSGITPAAIVPAAVAPSARGSALESEPSPATPAASGAMRLPAPVFDEPAAEPSYEPPLPSSAAPSPEAPESSDSLPGVDEPSIFEPDDELDQAPDFDQAPPLPSSANAYDPSEALDASLDEEPALVLDAPAA